MDSYIKNSIELRKQAIFDYYEIKNKELLEEVEELFNRINELGHSSKDVTEFETKFANSELNTEYINLITEIAKKCKLKKEHKAETFSKEDIKDYVKEEVKDQAKYLGSEAYMNTRSVIDREYGITDKIRRTPVLGTVWEIDNQTNIIGNIKDKIFKKRKSKESEEETEEETEELSENTIVESDKEI